MLSAFPLFPGSGVAGLRGAQPAENVGYFCWVFSVCVFRVWFLGRAWVALLFSVFRGAGFWLSRTSCRVGAFSGIR